MPKRLAVFGYIVDVPDTQSASVKWKHGDLQVDVLIEYSDQHLAHAQVLKVLRGVVAAMEERLAAP